MKSKSIAWLLVLLMTVSTFTVAFAEDFDFSDKSLAELEQMLEDEEAKDDPDEDKIDALEDAIEALNDADDEGHGKGKTKEKEEGDDEDDDEDDDDAYEYLDDIDDIDALKDLLEQAVEDGDLKLQLKIQRRILKLERNEFREGWEADKDAMEAEKDALEDAKDEAEKAYHDALEDGGYSEEELADLKLVFEEAKQDFFDLKAEFKALIDSRKAEIQALYTDSEIEALKEAAKKIKDANPNDTVIPFDSIFSNGTEFKFDTPPVIRSGRTLIPVRAITEGFGATVTVGDWDEESKEITITKPASGDADEIVIYMDLVSGEVTVDGEDAELEVPGNIMNNRTYVPLRFILETFGKKVKWDSDNETIEIENEDD